MWFSLDLFKFTSKYDSFDCSFICLNSHPDMTLFPLPHLFKFRPRCASFPRSPLHLFEVTCRCGSPLIFHEQMWLCSHLFEYLRRCDSFPPPPTMIRSCVSPGLFNSMHEELDRAQQVENARATLTSRAIEKGGLASPSLKNYILDWSPCSGSGSDPSIWQEFFLSKVKYHSSDTFSTSSTF